MRKRLITKGAKSAVMRPLFRKRVEKDRKKEEKKNGPPVEEV